MPVTANRSFCIPNTGDLPAAWGTSAINPNFQYLDALIGGVSTIALSAATTITLSVPPTTGTSSGAVTQSQNAVIRFTGSQSGNAVINFTLPGYYIVDNRCTGGFYVQLVPGGGGNKIGAPNGQKCHVFYDGTDMDYVNMPPVGSSLDLTTNTTTLPPWMQACTVAPYLPKDGATRAISSFPALFQLLGTTYGGDGVTTFGMPDERGRFRLSIDNSGAGRVTSAVSNVNGAIFNGGGGDQRLATHSHGITDPSHSHAATSNSQALVAFNAAIGVPQTSPTASVFPAGSFFALNTITTGNATTNITINNNTNGGNSANIPPCLVCTLPLVKTVILVGFLMAALNVFPSNAFASASSGITTASELTSQTGQGF